jgi:hypothetical protein
MTLEIVNVVNAAATEEVVETQLDSATDEQGSTTESTDGHESDVTSSETESTEGKKSGIEKRIDKLTKRVTERDREIEYWKQEALKSKPTPPIQQAPALSNKPKFSDYNDIEQYTEAAVKWSREQDRAEQTQTKSVKTYQDREVEFAKLNPDYYDIKSAADDIHAEPEIHEAILASDNGPALVYYLSQNEDVVARINALSPRQRSVEMGKLDASLTPASVSTKSKTVSTAPAPIKTVTAAKAPASRDINNPDLPYVEWKKLREAQIAEKRKR